MVNTAACIPDGSTGGTDSSGIGRPTVTDPTTRVPAAREDHRVADRPGRLRALARWAADDLRSVNAQIEVLLRAASTTPDGRRARWHRSRGRAARGSVNSTVATTGPGLGRVSPIGLVSESPAGRQ